MNGLHNKGDEAVTIKIHATSIISFVRMRRKVHLLHTKPRHHGQTHKRGATKADR